ncbi:hypothetical protein [Sorangium sp. So ce1389]|uniref:hypothetical protein n=1 Tax=Sorangium sp. So ce1389 TaxID=3133336 RepID=UPI003F5F59F4
MSDADKIVAMLVESGSLVEKDERGRIHASISSYDYRRYDVRATTRSEMSADAALAAIEVARHRYALPAAEATKQAAEITKQATLYTWRHAMVCIVILLCGLMVCFAKDAGPYILGMVGILSGVYGVTTVVERKKAALPPAATGDGRNERNETSE